MATREEKIAFLQSQASSSQGPTRAQKIAFLQAAKDQPQANTSQAQTALESFGNGASQGYLAQLQALAEPITDRVFKGMTLDQNVEPAPLEQAVARGESYVKSRDANIARQAAQAKANPTTAMLSNGAGMITSGIATAPLLPGASVAKGAPLLTKIAQGALQGTRAGAVYGITANPGDTEGVVDPLQAAKRVENAGTAMKYGGTIGATAPIIAAGINSGIRSVNNSSNTLKKVAEKSAVNSTGATGKQASTFKDDAGRQLLDRKIVRFGDSQEKIAERAAEAVKAANSQIDEALTKLDAQGVTVDANEIRQKLAEKIQSMRKDASQSDIAKMLQNEIDNVAAAAEANGSPKFNVSAAEKTKRGYNRKAGNWADPEKSMAGKEMYQTYRGAVEDAAQAADPATAKLFEEGKKAHGLLAPIEEAAQRRASTTAQSPAGGLADITAAGVGMLKGGPVGAIAAPVARRLIAPRLASSVAVTADKASDLLRKLSQFAEMEAKDPTAFQAMVSRLSAPLDNAPATMKAADHPKKGPDKWASDGLDKLNEHAGDDDKETLEKAKSSAKDPATKKLLIAASDLKSGSRAMSKVMSQLKTKLEGGR